MASATAIQPLPHNLFRQILCEMSLWFLQRPLHCLPAAGVCLQPRLSGVARSRAVRVSQVATRFVGAHRVFVRVVWCRGSSAVVFVRTQLCCVVRVCAR